MYLLFVPTFESRVWALVVFAIASFTDLLDGWSARKLGQESEFGQFFDPLADKILVISSMVALLFLDPLIPFWMIIIIVGRDFLITFMRWLAIREGKSLRTSHLGKFKTAFQMIGIIIIIMIYMFRKSGIAIPEQSVLQVMESDHPEKWLIVGPYWIMMTVTLLTALSGLRYVVQNRHLFSQKKLTDSDG